MIKDSTQETIDAIKDEQIKPPGESHLSTVLNGAGNGLTLGAIPLLVAEIYSRRSGKELSGIIRKGGTLFTGISCALGTMYGVREAKSMSDYRNSVTDQIKELRDKVEANEGRIKTWAEKSETTDTPDTKVASR